MIHYSNSTIETQKIAQELARSSGRVFALVGELGSGKTTFAQAFLRALGVRGRITSPTFVLIKKYNLDPKSRVYQQAGSIPNPLSCQYAYHIDCYRLHDPRELESFGLKELLADPAAMVLIEWAERVKDFLPAETVWVSFTHGHAENERIIEVN